MGFKAVVPAPDLLAAASISPGERVFKPAGTPDVKNRGFSPGGCSRANQHFAKARRAACQT
jgi:hypothetical protein